MDLINTEQFTNKVQSMIDQSLNSLLQSKINQTLQELAIKVQVLEQQYQNTYMMLLNYLKSGFEQLREQLSQDFLIIQEQNQSGPLVSQVSDSKIQEKMNQLSLKVNEMENHQQTQLDQLKAKVQNIAINKDEIIEEIKSFDQRIQAQWEGIANLSDDFNQLKIGSETPQQTKKKFIIF